jgi:hypothetical protein
MKTIEEIIRSDKDFFEEEPMDGHFERFKLRLEKKAVLTVPKRSIVPYLLRAAVVTVLVTLSSLWTWDHFLSPGSKRTKLGQVSPQYREVENYYVRQVTQKEDELIYVDLKNHPGQRAVLMKEMRSMDSVYISLQKELKANPDDERIINAMIEHYQTKLEVMTYIVDQLKSVKSNNQNNRKNEKSSL